jgi:PAS domain S-box-containing protein
MFNPPNPPDETAKLHKMQVTSSEQVRQLNQRVSDLIDLLRAQRDILRQRGMNLPSGTIDSLKVLQGQLKKMGDSVTANQTELTQLRSLAGNASLINSELDTMDVLKKVMDTVVGVTGAERGYIALKNPVTGEMEYPVARNIDREQLGKGEFVISKSIVNNVYDTGESVLTDNAQNDERFQGRDSIVNFKLRSIMAVPLKAGDEIIGVVYCDNSFMSGLFKQHELNLLKAIANQAAVAIVNARLFEDLQVHVAQMTEARDMMDNIFTSIASGVLTINRGNVVTNSNATTERILGKPRDAMVGKALDEVMPGLNGEFNEGLKRVREIGSRERLNAEPILEGMGQRYWNLIMSPLRDTNNIVQGAALVLDDLTAIHEREEQIRNSRIYIKIPVTDMSLFEAQEREISVMHCDVRGFTKFSEQFRLEPEKLMEIINRYLSLSSDAIDLYGGIVDKYMGDAVTGLFNTQFNPMEDHAVRAVRAAMSMKSDLYALHEELPEGHQLYYGIGVHSGIAVLGNVGSDARKEFSALGDAADFGKLLQENAEGGEVLISEATYEAVKDFFECEPKTPDPSKMKGHADFKIYRVLKHKKRPQTQTLDIESLDLSHLGL